MKDKIQKAFSNLVSAVTESSYEPYRKEFESSIAGESVEKNPNGSYTDPNTEAKWNEFCDSKTDAVLQQW
ncbi:hypothetical protein [Pseudomonas pergaminensis]|uniref:hypothetical protein n=1 Tax=Pseudomonas pergaminensis TaxID=2853159 RepID=UPI0034D64D32